MTQPIRQGNDDQWRQSVEQRFLTFDLENKRQWYDFPRAEPHEPPPWLGGPWVPVPTTTSTTGTGSSSTTAEGNCIDCGDVTCWSVTIPEDVACDRFGGIGDRLPAGAYTLLRASSNTWSFFGEDGNTYEISLSVTDVCRVKAQLYVSGLSVAFYEGFAHSCSESFIINRMGYVSCTGSPTTAPATLTFSPASCETTSTTGTGSSTSTGTGTTGTGTTGTGTTGTTGTATTGTGTTGTTATSTTTPEPCTGAGADWEWNGVSWDLLDSDCESPCAAFPPCANGSYVGQVLTVNCAESDPCAPTTTTTATTTGTTGTTGTTATTTGTTATTTATSSTTAGDPICSSNWSADFTGISPISPDPGECDCSNGMLSGLIMTAAGCPITASESACCFESANAESGCPTNPNWRLYMVYDPEETFQTIVYVMEGGSLSTGIVQASYRNASAPFDGMTLSQWEAFSSCNWPSNATLNLA